MSELVINAYAKLNLTLDILRRREDGYHDLRMVMQSISLHDTVALSQTDTGEMELKSGADFLPIRVILPTGQQRRFLRPPELPIPAFGLRWRKISLCAPAWLAAAAMRRRCFAACGGCMHRI